MEILAVQSRSQPIEVRAEKPEDVEAIRQVNIAAFGRENEANLVDHLRRAAVALSFVAAEAGQIVGHVCFSPVEVEGNCIDAPSILGLAPVAILPDYQRQGIGTALIQQSLPACAQKGYTAVVVLGHPGYYPRFGFVPAKQKRLTCEYDVPDEVFMVLELKDGALDQCRGTVKYRPEFGLCE